MKIIITVREAFEHGIWEKLAERHGYNFYALNEGYVNAEDEVTLTKWEAIELGLIESKETNCSLCRCHDDMPPGSAIDWPRYCHEKCGCECCNI